MKREESLAMKYSEDCDSYNHLIYNHNKRPVKRSRHEIFDIKRRGQSYDIRAVDFEPPYFDFIIAHVI